MSEPEGPVITSRQNPVIKELVRISHGKGVKKLGKTLVAGEKLVGEALARMPDSVEAWITVAEGMPGPPRPIRHHRLSPGLYHDVDVFGTGRPLLLVRTPEMPVWDPGPGLPPGMTLLVPFQDPENVGAVIRSAHAFAADRVVLLREAAHPFHPKAVRASGGSVFGVPLLRGPGLEELPGKLPLTSLSREGTDIARFTFPEPCGLLAGIEGRGLPASRRGDAVAVPIAPGVDSLNAAVGVAIALYLWARTRQS